MCVRIIVYTTQHRTVLIIVPLVLRTTIIAQMTSTGGEGKQQPKTRLRHITPRDVKSPAISRSTLHLVRPGSANQATHVDRPAAPRRRHLCCESNRWRQAILVAESFYIMKLCSRLFVLYCRSCPKDDKFRYCIPILRKLGAV